MTTREIELYAKAKVAEEMKYEVIPIDEVARMLNVGVRWIQSHLKDVPHGSFNGRAIFFKGDIVSLIRYKARKPTHL